MSFINAGIDEAASAVDVLASHVILQSVVPNTW